MAGLLGERDGSGKIWGDGDSAGEGGGGDARSRDHNGTKARGLGGAVVGERVLELGAGELLTFVFLAWNAPRGNFYFGLGIEQWSVFFLKF